MNMEELFKKMGTVVEENMTAYKSDFYEHDVRTLQEAKQGDVFYWLVRKTGTQLMGKDVLVRDSNVNFNFKYWHSHAIVAYKITVNEDYELVKVNKKRLWDYVLQNEKNYQAIIADVKFVDETKEEIKDLEVAKDNIDKYGTLPYAIAHKLREQKRLAVIDEIKKIYNIRYILA